MKPMEKRMEEWWAGMGKGQGIGMGTHCMQFCEGSVHADAEHLLGEVASPARRLGQKPGASGDQGLD